MFVDYRGSLIGLFTWQWKNVVLFTLAGVSATVVHYYADGVLPKASALPIGIMGGAIGIFVSFRTNSAYQRWWEGRKLWGRLVNVSRHFATQALVYLKERPEEARTLVRRQILYVHVLRCLLRLQDSLSDPDVKAFITEDEAKALKGQSNQTHAILHLQMTTIAGLAKEGAMTPEILRSFDDSIRVMLDVQGGCERIKKTPFPRGYAFISERLIMALGVLLPWTVLHEMGLWALPISMLVCLAFAFIGETGRVLEDPFTMFWPALPLSALSKTIEINLRDRLGETELPKLPAPNERGVLM